MTKEEIERKILEKLEQRNYYTKDQKNAYILGYLHACIHNHEISCDEFTDLLEELIND